MRESDMCQYRNPAASRVSVTLTHSVEPRTVTYTVNTHATKRSLKIPYVVAIDGMVITPPQDIPERVSGDNGKITIEGVSPGKKVALYLNSDAHPDYRKEPVYEVTVGDQGRDVAVQIVEKKGKNSVPATHHVPQPANPTPGATVDKYNALLTGDVWMKITHKYTAAEVEGLVPATTGPEILAAVKSIYDGLPDENHDGIPDKDLKITIPREGKPPHEITVHFNNADNPVVNITSGFTLRDQGLPRVHPAAYAAIFTAALDAGAKSLLITSAWRPCHGQIPHRAGLGIDVGELHGIILNRQHLRDPAKNAVTYNEGNQTKSLVSTKEEELLAAYEQAEAKETTKKQEYDAKKQPFDAAKAELKKAEDAEKKLKADATQAQKDAGKPAQGKKPKTPPPTPEQLDAAQKTTAAATKKRDEAKPPMDKAKAELDKATEERQKAEKAWCDERDSNQPEVVRKFRASLVANPTASEVLDPWLMDYNTHEAGASANRQRKDSSGQESDETGHAHHLHLTVSEPKLIR